MSNCSGGPGLAHFFRILLGKHRHAHSAVICIYLPLARDPEPGHGKPARVYRLVRRMYISRYRTLSEQQEGKRRSMSQRMNYHAASPAGMKALGPAYGYVRQ